VLRKREWDGCEYHAESIFGVSGFGIRVSGFGAGGQVCERTLTRTHGRKRRADANDGSEFDDQRDPSVSLSCLSDA
jgi:hypothetical protein